MDHEDCTKEEANFIKEKCLGVVNKTKNLNLNLDEVEFAFYRLDGISNKIFRVTTKSENPQFEFDLFFKLFGKISSRNFIIFNFLFFIYRSMVLNL